MKSNLLEQIIKTALLEQFDVKKVMVKQMPNSKRNQVVANGGVTGFEVYLNFREKHGDVTSILENIRTYITADPRVGTNSKFDVNDTVATDTSRYMYVIGDDVSKSKRRMKLNVWIIAYSPLHQLAEKIDSLNKNDRFQLQLEGILEYYIGKIPVYTWNDAAKWIAILKTQAATLKFELFDPQLKRKVEFPNLSIINKPESATDIDVQTKIVTIDDTNPGEYGLGDFKGQIEVSYNTSGQQLITYINGGPIGVSRQRDGEDGQYTGQFEKGMPSDGVVNWNDGEKWEGKLISTKTTDADGNLNFTFIQDSSTKITNSTSSTKSKLIYPYTIPAGNSAAGTIVYTMSDTDKWVYVKVNDEWHTTNKIDFERFELDGGSPPNSKVIPKTETDVYAKLDALIK